MHTHGNKESLVYWLEFKNDDEFSWSEFWQHCRWQRSQIWSVPAKGIRPVVGGSPKNEQNITEAEAISLARKHRDQLLLGVDLLGQLPKQADDPAYLALQMELQEQAPDICGLAWAHKYWSLLFPEKIDDFHNERWQRYNLMRLLETPPSEDGLYVCAGRFVRLASLMNWPINQLTAALNERNGQPVRYWRVGTRLDGGEGSSIWPAMRDGQYVAIGWPNLDDLSSIAAGEQVRDAVRALLEEHYPAEANVLSRKAGEIRDFIGMQDGDVVLAAEGEQVLGVGRVTGPYRYETTEPTDAPHRRSVNWSGAESWKLPKSEGLRTTCFPIRKYPENIIEIERRLLGGETVSTPKIGAAVPTRSLKLEGTPGRIQAILERKGQAITYGPPGTGKTFWARHAAHDIAAISAFGRLFAELSAEEQTVVRGNNTTAGLVRLCTFHPSFGYEDFIEGFRPRHQRH